MATPRAAFGKDHNTPVDQLANGPYDRTPTGRGFDYFYGFIAGETSQWEPALWENTTPIEPPHVENYEDYHLTEAMADKAIAWMRRHLAMNPDRPFLMWWTPGAVHGPHHVAEKWTAKYKGKFSDGWDAYQERVFERQKAMGWIPADTIRPPRPKEMPAWKDLSDKERAFQERLMEVYAGFLEHTDVQVGKLIDELEARGIRDNTMVIYILSDNGASAEGMGGSVAELNAQNAIPSTVEEHIAVAEQLGGLEAIGGPKMDNMYHSAWAWAGDSPFRYTKLIAADWGGTRTPMVISWPKRIKPDKTPRPQFLHVNDVVPTIYEILGIQAPKVVDGHPQDPIDGTSFVYTFDSPTAPERKKTQYFDIMGSRGIYHEGWMASAFGPRKPWVAEAIDLNKWDPMEDEWQLFDTRKDFSLMHDLAAEQSGETRGTEGAVHGGGRGEQGAAHRCRPLHSPESPGTEEVDEHGMDALRWDDPHPREPGAQRPKRQPPSRDRGRGAGGRQRRDLRDGRLRRRSEPLRRRWRTALRIQRPAAQARQDHRRQATRRQGGDRVRDAHAAGTRRPGRTEVLDQR